MSFTKYITILIAFYLASNVDAVLLKPSKTTLRYFNSSRVSSDGETDLVYSVCRAGGSAMKKVCDIVFEDEKSCNIGLETYKPNAIITDIQRIVRWSKSRAIVMWIEKETYVRAFVYVQRFRLNVATVDVDNNCSVRNNSVITANPDSKYYGMDYSDYLNTKFHVGIINDTHFEVMANQRELAEGNGKLYRIVFNDAGNITMPPSPTNNPIHEGNRIDLQSLKTDSSEREYLMVDRVNNSAKAYILKPSGPVLIKEWEDLDTDWSYAYSTAHGIIRICGVSQSKAICTKFDQEGRPSSETELQFSAQLKDVALLNLAEDEFILVSSEKAGTNETTRRYLIFKVAAGKKLDKQLETDDVSCALDGYNVEMQLFQADPEKYCIFLACRERNHPRPALFMNYDNVFTPVFFTTVGKTWKDVDYLDVKNYCFSGVDL